MRLRRRVRIPAILLVLVMLLTTAAHALTLDQARELIATYYIDEVPDAVLSQPTIPSILEALGDPYTAYFSPGEYESFLGLMEDATTAKLVDGHIGYLSCNTFGSDTASRFFEGIGTYGDQADIWIVNLMENGGGLIDAAVQTASAFTGSGAAGYFMDNTGALGYCGTDNEALTNSPVIVLSNGHTASASELFCAAVRDYRAGIIVGERSYGKGVAQSLLDGSNMPSYFDDGSALKITTARYYSYTGNTTDTIGVIPHLVVDDALAPDVAYLLSAPAPQGDTGGMLRIDLGGVWYIDLDIALGDSHRAAFTALLEAIAPTVQVREGTGADGAWTLTTAHALAEKYQLADYRARSFPDASASAFPKQIEILATYGILKGSDDGSFHPEDSLTRGQLCAMLAQALHCRQYSTASQFSDVPMDSWYGPSVYALQKLGLVSGAGDGTFRPDAPVDHQQFMTIMGRLATTLNLALAESADSMPQGSALPNSLSPYASWAQADVWLLGCSQQDMSGNDLNLLWDEVSQITPHGATTREEAAALLYSILSYTGILPA